MKIGLGYIPEIHRVNDVIDAKISFKPLINHLENDLKTANAIKARLYGIVLDEFYKNPDLSNIVETGNIHRYENILELIYTILCPLTESEGEHLWAMSAPMSKYVFFGTDAYVKLVDSQNSTEQLSDHVTEERELIKKRLKRIAYKLILNKFYNINPISSEKIIYEYIDTATGLTKYYQLKPDMRFIEINYKGELPPLNTTNPHLYMQNGEVTSYLEETLPLSNFYLEGFTVLTLEDVTDDHAVEIIKKALVAHSENEDVLFEQVVNGLKLLCGNADIEFGILPFLSLNNKLIFDNLEHSRSVLMSTVHKSEKNIFSAFASAEEFLRDPGVRIYNVFALKEKVNGSHMNALAKTGIRLYCLLPVYYNQKAVGILEIYSHKDIPQFENTLPRLNHALPLIAQLLQNSIEQFENKIENIITDKFTGLQPAVRWRFNEIALKYYRRLQTGSDETPIEGITFQNVYPLYGMIDVRNSTVERNRALEQDIKSLSSLFHFEEANIYDVLKDYQAIEDVQGRFAKWYNFMDTLLQSGDSVHFNLYLQTDVLPSLQTLLNKFPGAENSINRLIDILKKDGLEVSGSRNKLEASMQKINTALNSLFSIERDELMRIYPCYFETFRTDGVEYDLYVGQSISPAFEFSQEHIDAFRIWQLRSMTTAASLTSNVLNDDDWQLSTTQLIYVNPHPIDISFRVDERHFDVDGSYNIRYQIIKKRIDKVKIKNTGERLTQPYTIAIVYFNDHDIKIYLKTIELFQVEGLLNHKIEFVELEDLQGVYGLKAIRVSINL